MNDDNKLAEDNIEWLVFISRTIQSLKIIYIQIQSTLLIIIKIVIIISYLHITAAVWKIETVLEKELIIREDSSVYYQCKFFFGEEQKANSNNFIFTIQDIKPITSLDH